MTDELTKEEMIVELQKLGIQFNPSARPATLQKLLEDHKAKVGSTLSGPAPEPEKGPAPDSDLLSLMRGIKDSLGSLDDRLSQLEGRPSSAYKAEARSEDIERASESNSSVDPKVVAIVEEILGTDFKVSLKSYEDRPGFLFTVTVPSRLSDNVLDQRPKKKENGEYEKDSFGNVVMEPYYPDDNRSKSIGSADSYTSIREHCEKVRAYIVNHYQKMNKPLPEFKYKTL